MLDVIVTFSGPALAGVPLPAGLAGDARRIMAVRAAQEALLGRLEAVGDHLVNRRFDYTPQVALRVDRRVLEALLADPDLTVVESRPRRISLVQSVSRIYSNHATSPYTGSGWSVAVLDTGVDRSHPFLGGRVESEACYSDLNGTGSGTVSLCPNGSGTQIGTGAAVPCTVTGCEHGTHVAGIAAGDGGNFDGVARQAGIIAIQVFSRADDSAICSPDPTPCLVAYPEDIISGLERVYALRNSHRIAAVNLSLGGERLKNDCSTEPEKPMIDQLRAAGIAAVAASGNGGFEDIDAPACVPNAIAVGSTKDTADVRSGFSNNGPALDLYAPGETITSSVPGGGYADKEGTSMATAHVSGALAVLKQLKPAASVDGLENALKGSGVAVVSNAVSRQRIDVREALCNLDMAPSWCGAEAAMAPIMQLLLLD